MQSFFSHPSKNLYACAAITKRIALNIIALCISPLHVPDAGRAVARGENGLSKQWEGNVGCLLMRRSVSAIRSGLPQSLQSTCRKFDREARRFSRIGGSIRSPQRNRTVSTVLGSRY
ncbi:MAG: hypothetical protein NNA19_12810 [Nitrospira sp.]|nr:hypothetical protein [Nitrospira sp.]